METKNNEKIIKEFLDTTGLAFFDHSFCVEEDGTCWYRVRLDGLGEKVKIEDFVQSLNYLVRRMIESKNKENIEHSPLVDVNDFYKNKVNNIRTIAHMMAERARYFKSKVEVDPMPAFERRVVHEYLSNKSDIKTESVGFGKDRRVTISYIEESTL